MKKYLFFALIISIININAACADKLGGIKGIVIDGFSNKPIDGVSVIATTRTNIESELKYAKHLTKTNKKGEFVIKGIRKKDYSITYSAKNYISNNDSITIPNESNYIYSSPIKLIPLPIEWLEYSDLTVRDRFTGLTWPKNLDEHFKDKKDIILKLNDAHFGGFTDWRLPTTKELQAFCRTTISYFDKYKNLLRINYYPDILSEIGIKLPYGNCLTSTPSPNSGKRFGMVYMLEPGFGRHNDTDDAGWSIFPVRGNSESAR